MRIRPFFHVIGLSIVFLMSYSMAASAAEKEKESGRPDNGSEEVVFELREISAFGKGENESYHLTRGQLAQCSETPDKEVKAYPKLKSKHPLYGKVKFGEDRLDPGKGEGIEFHFVLDESGETPKNEKVEEKQSKSSSESSEKAAPRDAKKEGTDEKPLKEAPLSSYDRLYFDLNHDLDLTNDPVLKPLKDAPWESLPPWPVEEKAAFEYLNVDFDYGPGIGVRPFRILPWLLVGEKRTVHTMYFVATTMREGRIRIGKREYDALLAQPYESTAVSTCPSPRFILKPVDPKDNLPSWGFERDSLMTMQRVDGELYTIAASPLGDKLTVKPYRGDFGIFTVGPGGRKIEEKDIFISGSLRSKTAEIGFGPERS